MLPGTTSLGSSRTSSWKCWGAWSFFFFNGATNRDCSLGQTILTDFGGFRQVQSLVGCLYCWATLGMAYWLPMFAKKMPWAKETTRSWRLQPKRCASANLRCQDVARCLKVQVLRCFEMSWEVVLFQYYQIYYQYWRGFYHSPIGMRTSRPSKGRAKGNLWPSGNCDMLRFWRKSSRRWENLGRRTWRLCSLAWHFNRWDGSSLQPPGLRCNSFLWSFQATCSCTQSLLRLSMP